MRQRDLEDNSKSCLKIKAIQAIRERFGGGVHEALVTLHRRYDRLRWERSDEFAKDADSYWDGFHS